MAGLGTTCSLIYSRYASSYPVPSNATAPFDVTLFFLFTQVESLTAPVDHRNTSDEIISSLHGHNGAYIYTPCLLNLTFAPKDHLE